MLCISVGASWQARKHALYKLPLDLGPAGWAWGSVPPLPLSGSATLSNTLNCFSKLQAGWTQQVAHMFSKWEHCLCSINLMQGLELETEDELETQTESME